MNPELLEALQTIVEPPPLFVEYRLYYNEDGAIVKGTMIAEETTEPYVVVTQAEYDRYFNYTVVNGKLKPIDRDPEYRVQLEKATQGFCVVKDHAGVVIEPNETYKDIEYYAIRNY
mgnify:CR=1 FL=1